MDNEFKKILQKTEAFNRQPPDFLLSAIMDKVEVAKLARGKRKLFGWRLVFISTWFLSLGALINLVKAWNRAGVNDFLRLILHDGQVVLENGALFLNSLLEVMPVFSAMLFCLTVTGGLAALVFWQDAERRRGILSV